MGHSICAIVLQGPFDRGAAEAHDLLPVELRPDLTLFHVDHYYTAVWQKRLGLQGDLEGPRLPFGLLPAERCVAVLMSRVSGRPEPRFVLLETDYFGGIGHQWALAYQGERCLDPSVNDIDGALRCLGVQRSAGLDEFDTVGLARIRSQPAYLEKYQDLADELGV